MSPDKLHQALQVLGEVVRTNDKLNVNRMLVETAIHKIKEFMEAELSGLERTRLMSKSDRPPNFIGRVFYLGRKMYWMGFRTGLIYGIIAGVIIAGVLR